MSKSSTYTKKYVVIHWSLSTKREVLEWEFTNPQESKNSLSSLYKTLGINYLKL